MDDSTYGNAVCDSKKRLMLVASSPSAQWCPLYMITPLQGHSFSITDPLWGKSIGQRLILLTKGVELWCFLSYQPEQTYELTVNRQVSWRSFDIIVIRCLWQGLFCTMRFIYLTWTRSFGHVLVFDMVLLIFVYLGLIITQFSSKHCYDLKLHYMKSLATYSSNSWTISDVMQAVISRI